MALKNQLAQLDGQLNMIQNDVTTVQSQANGLQTSINKVNSRFDNTLPKLSSI